jgi:hypothetical protein
MFIELSQIEMCTINGGDHFMYDLGCFIGSLCACFADYPVSAAIH